MRNKELKSTGDICHYQTGGKKWFCHYNHRRTKCKNCIEKIKILIGELE